MPLRPSRPCKFPPEYSKLRGAITPTRRQQGGRAGGHPGLVSLGLARLLKRIFAIDLERGPTCHQGTLRIIAAITSGPIIARFCTTSNARLIRHR